MVFVKEVGAIDNATYRQLSGADILKASIDLRTLRDMNLLTANGKSKLTYYTAGPSMLSMQDKQIGMQDIDLSMQDKSINIQDKPKSIQDIEEYKLEDRKEIEALLNILPQKVKNQIADLGRRSGERQEMEQLILDICTVRPFTVKELSSLLGRHIKHLQSSYLKPLIITGKLKYVIQDMPKHPDQAYTTT